MSSQEKIGYALAFVVVVPLLALVLIAPVFIVVALFVLGAVGLAVFSIGWALVQGVKVGAPALASAMSLIWSAPVQGFASAEMALTRLATLVRPAKAVRVQITRIDGLCPLGLCSMGQMFVGGTDVHTLHLPCEKSRRLIAAGLAGMMQSKRLDATVQCVGPRHLIEFRIERVPAMRVAA